MTDLRMQPAPLDVDVAILGGGLSGGLCALALTEHAPQLRVALVEQDARLAGNHTWCCHGSDLAMSTGKAVAAWFSPLVQHRWTQYQVAFPDFARTMDGDYLCIPAESLQRQVARAMARPGTHLMLGERVHSATSRDVLLESGIQVEARLVLDARGSRTAKGACGYQKFLGWEIETDEAAPALGHAPTLMDARVQQLDGYRFVYVLPMSPTRFLVEDTYLSRQAVLDRETVSGRLRKYLAGRAVQRYEIVREESGVLPMPWSAGTDGDEPASEPVALGYRAGLFHPATGYSLAIAAQAADRIARSIGATQSESLHALATRAVADLQAELATNLRFARALNFLAFRAIPGPWLRSLVFSAVYRLPTDLLQRFYAAQTTPHDRLALLGAVARLPRPRLDLTSTHLNGETP
jgi:lycopene beta-cyclase